MSQPCSTFHCRAAWQLSTQLWSALLSRAQTLREAAQRGANASSGERRPADTLGATGQEILDAFEVRLAMLQTYP